MSKRPCIKLSAPNVEKRRECIHQRYEKQVLNETASINQSSSGPRNSEQAVIPQIKACLNGVFSVMISCLLYTAVSANIRIYLTDLA